MANRERGEVSLKAGDKTYTLVLDIDAMCALEDLFSTPEQEVSFPEVLAKVQRDSTRHLRAFLWALLQRHHPEIGIGQISELVEQAGGLEGLRDSFGAISESAKPDPKHMKASGARASKRP
jgi:hypothetical protein